MHYLKNYKNLLGSPSLVVCLDSVALTEETLTVTSSLRGVLTFDISTEVSTNHSHSGALGGIIPNPHSILTAALMRI
jgi:hypothetical protein